MPEVNQKSKVTLITQPRMRYAQANAIVENLLLDVKYSKEQVPKQYRHIKNEEKCAMTSHGYGDITERYVIYRGDNVEVDGVQYLNVEEYLKLL